MRLGISCADGRVPAEVLGVLRAAGLLAGDLDGAAPPALLPAAGSPDASAPSTAVRSWLLAGAGDVLAACERGALDAGIVGKDVLLESDAEVHELLDLGVPGDAVVHAVAGAPGTGKRPSRTRVATRYPRVARGYFDAAGLQVELLEFEAPALAVGLGLAAGVVELRSRLLVTVGAALEERAVVADGSARLVCGRAARTLSGAALEDIVERLRASAVAP
jgi:ATP phosphoribosyltransferase